MGENYIFNLSNKTFCFVTQFKIYNFFFLVLNFVCEGIEWSPRMDIAETGCNYVITVELAGINIKDIRVEIDDKK